MKRIIEIEVTYSEEDDAYSADSYAIDGNKILVGDLEEAIYERLQEIEKDTEERIRSQ